MADHGNNHLIAGPENREPSSIEPTSVMGMTPDEYRTAFAILEHENFQREVLKREAARRRAEREAVIAAAAPEKIVFMRFEFWGIVLAILALCHALFVQWLWPHIQRTQYHGPPYGHRAGDGET